MPAGRPSYIAQLEEAHMERSSIAHDLVTHHDAWESAALRALEEHLIAGTKRDLEWCVRIVRELRARDRQENEAHVAMVEPLPLTARGVA